MRKKNAFEPLFIIIVIVIGGIAWFIKQADTEGIVVLLMAGVIVAIIYYCLSNKETTPSVPHDEWGPIFKNPEEYKKYNLYLMTYIQ